MKEITLDDIQQQIQATKLRVVTSINEGRVEDDYLVASLDHYGELQECITTAIEAGRDDEDCDWGYLADVAWIRHEVKDMIIVLNHLIEEPTWD